MQFCHFVLLALFAFFGHAQQTRDPVPTARKAFDLLLGEKYSELRAMFNQKMLDALSEDMLRNQVGPQIKALGKPEKVGDSKVQKVQNIDVVVFPVKFPAGNFELVISIDDADKVAGLFIRPGETPKSSEWTSPPYSSPNSFHGHSLGGYLGPRIAATS